MDKKRPVNLDLTKFQFPLPAITSIIHRVTGVALFVGVGFLLWALEASLAGEASFNELKSTFDGFFVKLFFWGIAAAVLYHLVAGTKHLLMDAGVGETLEGGLKGAKITIAVSVVLILLAGILIW